MKILKDFEEFVNPDKFVEQYDYIKFESLKYCSYVDYVFIPTINEKINGNPKYIEFDELEKIKNEEVIIIATNHLDKISLEVIK